MTDYHVSDIVYLWPGVDKLLLFVEISDLIICILDEHLSYVSNERHILIKPFKFCDWNIHIVFCYVSIFVLENLCKI